MHGNEEYFKHNYVTPEQVQSFQSICTCPDLSEAMKHASRGEAFLGISICKSITEREVYAVAVTNDEGRPTVIAITGIKGVGDDVTSVANGEILTRLWNKNIKEGTK